MNFYEMEEKLAAPLCENEPSERSSALIRGRKGREEPLLKRNKEYLRLIWFCIDELRSLNAERTAEYVEGRLNGIRKA
ncbi:MAG: hypothetical protein A4E55_02374 [Pelotomaculum sp. PtaU1.Bin035]|nr:MAG: hypothetical protein A4E55_02374 [Pelotomaculum sp. PtaU1.Bin035]